MFVDIVALPRTLLILSYSCFCSFLINFYHKYKCDVIKCVFSFLIVRFLFTIPFLLWLCYIRHSFVQLHVIICWYHFRPHEVDEFNPHWEFTPKLWVRSHLVLFYTCKKISLDNRNRWLDRYSKLGMRLKCPSLFVIIIFLP